MSAGKFARNAERDLIATMLDPAWEALGRGVGPWWAAAVVTYSLGYLFAPSKLVKPADRAYYGSSILAILHGIVVSILALMAGLDAGFWTVTWEPWDYHAQTPATARCIHVFLAFLLTDLLPLFYYRKEWAGTGMYIGHHTLSCVAWGDALLNGTCHNVAVGLLLLEATSPFINGRYFLSTHGVPCAAYGLWAAYGVVRGVRCGARCGVMRGAVCGAARCARCGAPCWVRPSAAWQRIMCLAAAHTSAAQPQQPRPSSARAPIGRPQELTDLPVQRRGHGGLLPHTEDHRHG